MPMIWSNQFSSYIYKDNCAHGVVDFEEMRIESYKNNVSSVKLRSVGENKRSIIFQQYSEYINSSENINEIVTFNEEVSEQSITVNIFDVEPNPPIICFSIKLDSPTRFSAIGHNKFEKMKINKCKVCINI